MIWRTKLSRIILSFSVLSLSLSLSLSSIQKKNVIPFLVKVENTPPSQTTGSERIQGRRIKCQGTEE